MVLTKAKKNKLILVIAAFLFLVLIVTNSVLLSSRNKQLWHYPTGLEIEEYALTFLKEKESENQGKRLDCSGYTKEVYKHFGIAIPRSSYGQYKHSNILNVDNLEKGNLVFFSIKDDKISHVGIYLENGKFIHSPGRGKYVRIDSLNNKYWKERFIGGCKILI